MFDLEPGDELELLVETARSFAAEALVPKRREFEAAREVARPVRDAYRQIGLGGLEVPEALGGAGLGSLARALVGEELGAGDAGAALALDSLGPALYPIAELGGEAALRELAIPLLERDGARAVLVAARDADLAIAGDAISGRIAWVPADRIDLLVVLDDEGAFVVREGLDATQLRGSGLRAAGASELVLDAAPLAARWRDPAGAARSLSRARLYYASIGLGVLRHVCEFSQGYALERVAFGKPIAHHQALAFLIADMRMALDGARLLVHEAAWRLDEGLPAGDVAAGAFAEVAEASAFVGPNGVQILGGHGFMQDYPMEKAMREARALGLVLGGVDAAREDAGAALLEIDVPVQLSPRETT